MNTPLLCDLVEMSALERNDDLCADVRQKVQILGGEELPFRGGDIDKTKRFALRYQRHAGMEAQTLVITGSLHGISQACTFDDIDGTCETPFDEQMLAVASWRLAEKAAIITFEPFG